MIQRKLILPEFKKYLEYFNTPPHFHQLWTNDRYTVVTLPVCVMTRVIGHARPTEVEDDLHKTNLPTLSKKLKVQWAFYGIDPIEGHALWDLSCFSQGVTTCFRSMRQSSDSSAQFPFDACNSIQPQTHKEETRSAAFFFVQKCISLSGEMAV